MVGLVTLIAGAAKGESTGQSTAAAVAMETAGQPAQRYATVMPDGLAAETPTAPQRAQRSLGSSASSYTCPNLS